MITTGRALLLALALTGPALADECSDAVRDYNDVVIALTEATQRFSTCVAASLGMDSCATEYAHLHSAYNRYAAIVAFYSGHCEVKR
ncbi:MAG: hypothetical protein JOZ70_07145 [Pseudolabrys sp.]|nr:hypothetical protein [Pseudolabrys sp.]MBV9955010.1 hypothetical protein [Pseudolabrys sp.]